MKKYFGILLMAVMGAFVFSSCEDVPEPYGTPQRQQNSGTSASDNATKVSIAEALEIVNNLADGGTTAEEYAITGYITEVFGEVSRNQQSFWISDTPGGKKLFEAYYANLPEGFEQFTVGTKVTIVGKLMKFIDKNGNVVPEMKNAIVEVLEGGEQGAPVDATEVTCAQAAELVNDLADGGTSAETYAITGYITEVIGTPSASKTTGQMQQSFWIADTKDGGKVFQAYWANLPEGVAEFKAGTKVKIVGKLMKYVKNDAVTPEMKNALVEILEEGEGGEGSTVEPQGEGTLESPFNVSAAVAAANALGKDVESDKVYYIKGKVLANTTTESTITSYGNMTFTMVDEGDDNTKFTAFQVYGPGNKKFTSVDQIKVGDEVVVCGKIVNYKGNTPETVGKGTAYVYSINGKSEEGTPDPQPSGEAKGTGTLADPFNVAAVIAYVNGLGADVTSENAVYVKGKVLANNTTAATITSYGNMTFTMIDEGNEKATFSAYQVYGPNEEKFTSPSQIKVGDEVVVCGKVVNYKGNTPETVGKGAAYVYSINGSTEMPEVDEEGDPDPTPTPGDATEYSIDLKYTKGANCYDDGLATINGVSGCKTLKIGTSKAAGDFQLQVPAGKHTFYAITWKGAGTADVQFKNGETVVNTVTVKANDGATGNAPYTITVTDADKYEIEVATATTLTVTSDKRIIFFGIK